jgi:hypothetical protein
MFQLPFGGFIPSFNVDSQFTDTAKFESKIPYAGISKNERVQKNCWNMNC